MPARAFRRWGAIGAIRLVAKHRRFFSWTGSENFKKISGNFRSGARKHIFREQRLNPAAFYEKRCTLWPRTGSISLGSAPKRARPCRPLLQKYLRMRGQGERLRELSLSRSCFSIEATGFEMGEIDLCIEGLNAQNISSKRSRGHPARNPRSRLGGPTDCVRLRRNRLVADSSRRLARPSPR